MERVSRTVRFSKHEDDLIEEFLRENPFFDFSTLVRVSVQSFIKEPSLSIKAVKKSATPRRQKDATDVQ